MAGLVKRSLMWLIQLFVLVVFNKVTRLVIKYFKLLTSLVYSFYKASEFKSIGKDFLFECPMLIKGGKYIEIGDRFSTRSGFRIEAWDEYYGNFFKPRIIIGNNVVFNFDCHIGAINKIQIGNNVLIGSRVLITDHNHGEIIKGELEIAPYLRPLYSKGPVIIKDNVWIGEGVAILSGVTVGRNAIIGANSVVNSDVPENSIVGGIPARIIKQF